MPVVCKILGRAPLARLCGIGKDSHPSVVPANLAYVNNVLIFGVDGEEAKVRDVLRNPREAVM